MAQSQSCEFCIRETKLSNPIRVVKHSTASEAGDRNRESRINVMIMIVRNITVVATCVKGDIQGGRQYEICIVACRGLLLKNRAPQSRGENVRPGERARKDTMAQLRRTGERTVTGPGILSHFN